MVPASVVAPSPASGCGEVTPPPWSAPTSGPPASWSAPPRPAPPGSPSPSSRCPGGGTGGTPGPPARTQASFVRWSGPTRCVILQSIWNSAAEPVQDNCTQYSDSSTFYRTLHLVRSIELSTQYKVRNIELSTQYSVHNIELSTQHTVRYICSTQYKVHSKQYLVFHIISDYNEKCTFSTG